MAVVVQKEEDTRKDEDGRDEDRLEFVKPAIDLMVDRVLKENGVGPSPLEAASFKIEPSHPVPQHLSLATTEHDRATAGAMYGLLTAGAVTAVLLLSKRVPWIRNFYDFMKNNSYTRPFFSAFAPDKRTARIQDIPELAAAVESEYELVLGISDIGHQYVCVRELRFDSKMLQPTVVNDAEQETSGRRRMFRDGRLGPSLNGIYLVFDLTDPIKERMDTFYERTKNAEPGQDGYRPGGLPLGCVYTSQNILAELGLTPIQEGLPKTFSFRAYTSTKHILKANDQVVFKDPNGDPVKHRIIHPTEMDHVEFLRNCRGVEIQTIYGVAAAGVVGAVSVNIFFTLGRYIASFL